MSLFTRALQIHQSMYEATDGRLGHRLLGVPTLLLRTTGRRSGMTRTSALVYVDDVGRYVVVASNGGHHRPPAWLLNLKADPHVELQVGRERSPATATVINADDAEYDHLWRAANAVTSDRYDKYQSRTDRPIALVALTPND